MFPSESKIRTFAMKTARGRELCECLNGRLANGIGRRRSLHMAGIFSLAIITLLSCANYLTKNRGANGSSRAAPSSSERAGSAGRVAASPGREDNLTFVRAIVDVYGITQPDNAYNLYSRIQKLDGVADARFDMKRGRLTIDFQPGVSVSKTLLDEHLDQSGFSATVLKLVRVRVGRFSEAEETAEREGADALVGGGEPRVTPTMDNVPTKRPEAAEETSVPEQTGEEPAGKIELSS